MLGRNQINIPEPVQRCVCRLPNAFWVALARRDERESGESRPGGETKSRILCLSGPLKSFTATPHEATCHVTTG